MRKIFTPEQKAKIALSAIKGEKTINELASAHEAHPNIIGQWKKTITENASTLFSDKRKKGNGDKDDLIERLYATIGKREAELDWLKKNCSLSHEKRKALIVPGDPDFSLSRQSELLHISRSSLYYAPKENAEDKKLMDMIDAIYTDYPFYGSRRMKNELLDRYQICACREHIQRLMRKMGIEATRSLFARKKPQIRAREMFRTKSTPIS